MSIEISRFCQSPADVAELARAEDEAAGKPVAPRKAPKGAKALEVAGFEAIPHGGEWKLQGPCPACRWEGCDTKGRHLVIFDDGHFSCIKYPLGSDLGQREEHNQKIWAFLKPILGGKLKGIPAPDPAIRAAELAAIETAKTALAGAIEKFSGGLPVLGPSAPIPAEAKDHFRTFCGFFEAGDTAWAGHRFDHQHAFLSHVFDPSNWEEKWKQVQFEGLDHATGWTFEDAARGRKKDNRLAQRFLVVEHDELDRDAQIALIKFVSLRFRLLAVLDTAGKGYHGMFDAVGKSPVDISRLSQFLSAAGADMNSFRGSCTRTPGAIRQGDDRNPGGKPQLFVWINPSI
jgi:hypothetical protein